MPDGLSVFPPAATAGATAGLAAFVTAGAVDETAVDRAAAALLDTMAVTLAGGGEPAVRRLAGTLTSASDGAPGFCGPDSYGQDDATLLIGTASHVLDYDDVSMLTVCHPSAPVVSALLPLVWARNSPGRDMLEALAVGTEVTIRLGQAMGFRHYALGFHATGTLGAVGAAAACARLLRLALAPAAHALAIAASLSAGLRVNFGTNVKSLHVGVAASNGLRAARWAAAGLEGAAEAIEGNGFLHAFSGGGTSTWPADLVPGQPFAIVAPGFEQKRYPCCYMLHRMIEATLVLRAAHGLVLADVVSARVDVAQGGTSALIHPYPKTGLNALFSGPYAVLASLQDGRIDLRSFTDDAVLRPELQARLHDVALVEDAAPSHHGSDVGSAPVTVTLVLRDGARLSHTVTASPGSPEDPLTPRQFEGKWLDCLRRAAPSVGQARAEALLAEGQAISMAPGMRPWLSALRDTLAEH